MKFLALASILAMGANAQCTFPGEDATDAEKLAFKEKLDACRADYATLPDCTRDVVATRDPDTCCITCKDASLTTEPVCTDAQKKACYDSMPNLPECATGVRPTFSPESCCYDCKPVRDAATAPDADGTCTREKFAACMQNAPDCTRDLLEATRDLSLADLKDRCCPLCRPPQEAPGCTFGEAVRNTAELAECATGERPQPVPDSCSLSCRPAKPVCANCNDDQVCIRTRTGPQCAPRFVRRWRLKTRATSAVVRALVARSDNDRLREAAKEIIARKCRRVLIAASSADAGDRVRKAARRCAAFRRRIEDGLDVTRTDDGGDTATDIEIEIRGDATTSEIDPARAGDRRLLEVEDAGNLVDDAVGDVDGGALTIENIADPTPTPGLDDGTSAAGSVAASMFATVAALFFL